MSLWLTVSIWVLYTLWSLVEIQGYIMFIKYRHRGAHYTRISYTVTLLWVMFTVFWLSFQFIG